jgi:hypothetical protein
MREYEGFGRVGLLCLHVTQASSFQNVSLSRPKITQWSEKIACGCVLVFSKDRKGHVELVERKLCSGHK